MSNFSGVGRSNYVAVDDVEGLEAALSPWPIYLAKDAIGQIALIDDDADGCGWPTTGMNDDGEDVELDIAEIVMPFVKEGEVFVLMGAGFEKKRYASGWATAWVRRGDAVEDVWISLADIYAIAATKFGVVQSQITDASY